MIIAELACEHGGSMANAKRLIDAAKEAGADIAKFQLHVPDEEMVPNSIKFWAGSMDDVLRRVNFEKAEQHRELKEYCEKIGIQYLCTPFCGKAADILDSIGAEAFKTGSGELTNLPMLRHLARKKKPLIVSTGMSVPEEIAEAADVLKEEGANFALMNCTSEYPAKYENVNLGYMRKLSEQFGVLVGQSDHTKEIYTSVAAVALGAKIIEKHFTIRELHGPDDLVSLDPREFKSMVGAIRKIEAAGGAERRITEEESKVRAWAHHSVVAAVNIKEGDSLTVENLTVKRPGSGISAKFLDKNYSERLLGRRAKRYLPKNVVLQWEDIA